MAPIDIFFLIVIIVLTVATLVIGFGYLMFIRQEIKDEREVLKEMRKRNRSK